MILSRSRDASSFLAAVDQLPISGAIKRFVIPNNLQHFYEGGEGAARPTDFVAGVLERLSVQYEVTDSDLARVPRTGPVVVVSNHPFGILEGLILFEMLSRVRPDVKILSNSLLSIGFPEMRDALIRVDPFAHATSSSSNLRGVRETISYLAKGGLLVVFPAGEVSHFNVRQGRIEDPGWNENIARFIRHTRSTVVPIYIKGANSLIFQLVGLIHSQLRTARLLHELLNKQEKTIELRIGNPIEDERLAAMGDDTSVTRYLRLRTYLLENRSTKALPPGECLLTPPVPAERMAEILRRAARSPIEAEVSHLEKLSENGSLEVYRAQAAEIPNVLREIGRMREITFRAAGEGTGHTLDLDRHDPHYHHVFVWDRETKLLVGAYRLGVTDELLPRFGVPGLYTSSLFHFDKQFFGRIGPAIEMGRSFVRSEYQKQYAPLLLLWKGIGAFVAGNPGAPVLFGPVSISNDYHPVSRRLIVRYLQAQESVKDLAGLVKPRRKFQTRTRGSDNEAISAMLRDREELSSCTADIETDGKGIPILLKQYLKLGGKLLAFSVDPDFSNALDGLILVDLRQTPLAILQRYMGREGASGFLGYHQKANSEPHRKTVSA